MSVGTEGRLQGEGAIEGSYLEYRVPWVSSHGLGTHKYSRFVCDVAAGPAAFMEV